MNAIDRDAGGERQQMFITVWSEFFMAVEDALNSYSKHPQGQKYPAILKEAGDAVLLISCLMGSNCSQQPLGTLEVKIRAESDRGMLTIKCCIEKWCNSPVAGEFPQKESRRLIRFVWDEREAALRLNEDLFDPKQAAQGLILYGLLGKPL